MSRPPRSFTRPVDDVAALLLLADVAGHRDHRAAGLATSAAVSLGVLLLLGQVADQHVGALTGERERDGPADAGVTAGDDRLLAAQPVAAAVAVLAVVGLLAASSPVRPGCGISWPSPAGFECCSVGSCGWSGRCSCRSSSGRVSASGAASRRRRRPCPGTGAVCIPCAVGCMPGPRRRGPDPEGDRPCSAAIPVRPGAPRRAGAPRTSCSGSRTSSCAAGLRPGDPLPTEVDLCEAVGASRSSVREAIRTLCALDLVEVRHGHGTYVGRMSMDPLVQSVSFRGRLDRDEGSGLRREVVEVRERLDQSSARGAAGPARRARARGAARATRRAGPAAARPRRARRPVGAGAPGLPPAAGRAAVQRADERADRRLPRHRGGDGGRRRPGRPPPVPPSPTSRSSRRPGPATPRRCTPRSPPTTPRCWSRRPVGGPERSGPAVRRRRRRSRGSGPRPVTGRRRGAIRARCPASRRRRAAARTPPRPRPCGRSPSVRAAPRRRARPRRAPRSWPGRCSRTPCAGRSRRPGRAGRSGPGSRTRAAGR